LRIRLTFGAEPRQLFLGELARAARLVAVSACLGTAIAMAALRLLTASFSGFSESIAEPLAASVAIVVALALAATAIPAAQACRLDVLNRT